MRLFRFLRKFIFVSVTAGVVAGSALGFHDRLPPAVRDLVPPFVRTALERGDWRIGKTQSGSEEAYWPGLPISRSEKLVKLTRTGYCVGYSTKVFSPLWTAFAITSERTSRSGKRPATFMPDPDLPALYQVTTSEYTRSGYDRGHMAPNWAISLSYGREAQIETFYMTNIVPQDRELNQGLWQVLESIEANDYARRYGGVVTFAGPIYSSGSKAGIGEGGRIRVPSAFYRIIVRRAKGEVAVLAFVIPQTARGNGKALPRYLASVDEIERATGLDFLTALPEAQQTALEAKAATRLW